MNRRGFLSTLFGGAIVAATDPERLLWRPGAKLISIPRPKPVVLQVGQLITFEGHYEVNPLTGRRVIYTDLSTGRKFQFRKRYVVTAAIEEVDARREAMQLFPAPIPSGPYRNVDIGHEGRLLYAPRLRFAEEVHS